MRKILAMFLSILMFLSYSMVCSAEQLIFSEEDTEKYLNVLRGLEIFSLYEDEKIFFNDNEAVTRAEAAHAISDLLNCKDVGSGAKISEVFIDVPDFAPYASDVDAMVGLGIMVGMNNGCFEPEEPISVKNFVKAMVTALGWQWKAERSGGYPLGYISTAQQMGLLEGVSFDGDTMLNRAQMLKILFQSLEVPIYEIQSVANDKVSFSFRKKQNVLSQYHDIVSEKSVVYSDRTVSLKSGYQPQCDTVLLGENEVEVNGRNSVWNFLGYEIEYYYREKDESKQLLYFTETPRNESVTVSARDFEDYRNGVFSYVDENGKTQSVDVPDTAAVVVNGCLVTKNIDHVLQLKQGRMTLIGRSNGSAAEVVLIENCNYDKVEFVDASEKIIYGKEAKYDVRNLKYFVLTDEYDNVITIDEISPEDVIEIKKGEINSVLKMKVLHRNKTVCVSGLDVQNEIVETTEDEEFFVADGCNKKISELKNGKNYRIVLNRYREIVWLEEQTQSTDRFGYLIKAAETRKGLTVDFTCSILQENGTVVHLETGEKIRINGKNYKKEEAAEVLKAAKQNLGLASDGEVSQLIYYSADNGVVKEISTAGSEGENQNFYLKCNSEGKEIFYRNTGYLTGIFDSRYAVSSNAIIFKVPMENQERLDEDYFSVRNYSNYLFTDGDSFCVETYVRDKNEIVPDAVVWYSLSEGMEIEESANLFLVEKIQKAADSEGYAVKRMTGYYRKSKVVYDVLEDVDTENISAGDVVVISLNAGDKIQSMKKVYDYTNGEVATDFLGTATSDKRAVRHMKVYNVPENADFIEVIPVDYTGEIPEPEDILLISMKAVRSGSGNGIASCIGTRRFSTGEPSYITDYLHDAQNCTEVLVRFSSNYVYDVIFYDK